jgi:hypothetical protein
VNAVRSERQERTFLSSRFLTPKPTWTQRRLIQSDMAINLKVAKALGLAMLPSVLARADDVIE